MNFFDVLFGTAGCGPAAPAVEPVAGAGGAAAGGGVGYEPPVAVSGLGHGWDSGVGGGALGGGFGSGGLGCGRGFDGEW